MTFELSQRFFFDAAHTLKRSIGAEGSARIHGHTYSAEIAVQGCPDTTTGMVLDLGILREHAQRIRSCLDHRFLDEVDGLGVPTLENLCLYVERALVASGIRPCRVSIWREGIGDRCDLRLD